MAVLFRPVTERSETNSEVYAIEAYDGNIKLRAGEMKKMSAEQVQSALRFFFALGREFLMIMPSSLMEQLKEMKMQ